MSKIQVNLKEYKELISLYKEDLRNMNDKVNAENVDNLKTLQPMLREFHNNLKEKLRDEKSENYQLLREVEEFNRERASVQQQVVFCERRIIELEKSIGTSVKIDLSNDNINTE